MNYYGIDYDDSSLTHYGIKGMKWGVRKRRASNLSPEEKAARSARRKKIAKRVALGLAGTAAAAGAGYLAYKNRGRIASAAKNAKSAYNDYSFIAKDNMRIAGRNARAKASVAANAMKRGGKAALSKTQDAVWATKDGINSARAYGNVAKNAVKRNTKLAAAGAVYRGSRAAQYVGGKMRTAGNVAKVYGGEFAKDVGGKLRTARNTVRANSGSVGDALAKGRLAASIGGSVAKNAVSKAASGAASKARLAGKVTAAYLRKKRK